MYNLILFGPPGSGKGTQSDKIVEKYGLVHLSTGSFLRKEIAAQTPLGREAKLFIDKGHLVPDDLVIGMIDTILDENTNAKGFLFDGFPRTVVQAVALDRLLAQRKTSVSKVIALEVSEEELETRLLKRGKSSGRSDDEEKVIRNRLLVYRNQTEPVAQHYEKLNKFDRVRGEGSVDEIFKALCESIEAQIASQKKD